MNFPIQRSGPTDTQFDEYAWLCSILDQEAGHQSQTRLEPIFQLAARLAHPTTLRSGDGSWTLGVAVDRSDAALQAAVAAVAEVFNAYLDELESAGYVETVYMKTVRARIGTYLRAHSFKKWQR